MAYSRDAFTRDERKTRSGAMADILRGNINKNKPKMAYSCDAFTRE